MESKTRWSYYCSKRGDYTVNLVTSGKTNARLARPIRDISDQGLISCLHDQPRSGTFNFTTGDLLFVYTQYDKNEEHILMD